MARYKIIDFLQTASAGRHAADGDRPRSGGSIGRRVHHSEHFYLPFPRGGCAIQNGSPPICMPRISDPQWLLQDERMRRCTQSTKVEVAARLWTAGTWPRFSCTAGRAKAAMNSSAAGANQARSKSGVMPPQSKVLTERRCGPTLWIARAHLIFVQGSGAIPRIPKGFQLKAQSCPDASGLLWGSVHQRSSTPTGLRLLAPDGRARTSRNPVGVVLFVALLTQG